ncbi:MAG TPA: type II secretion system secretin GspD [Casimicrobiaceae bacterium]|nr:type II secretion system secretin GspD [Casimicrobiaceae bacterium]
MNERYAKLTLALALSFVLAACATTRVGRDAQPRAPAKVASSAADAAAALGAPSSDKPADYGKLYKGTGVLVAGQEEGGGVPGIRRPSTPPGPMVTLNFEGADIRDVVRNILGDILNESYTIDQAVGGTVTIRTTSGIPREALPATMEMLLRMNGATMTKESGVWKILPAAAAVRGNVTPQLGGSSRALPPGYSVQIVPLHYVGVRQMATLLEPFVKDQTTVRVDDLRNFMILSGTELELRHLIDTIEMFDINWMAGMSAGLFTLQSADVKSVMTELEKALGTPDKSPLAGILRVIPIERMNALLVITPQPEYLDEAKKWIERLDKAGTDSAGLRFYIYHVQNGRAERIAPLLQQAFTGRVAQTPQGAGPPTLAPGTPAGTIVSPPAFQPGTPVGAPQTVVTQTQTQTPTPAAPGAAQTTIQRALSAAEGIGVIRNIQVVADKDNNTILTVATPAEYAVIEAALKKLDIPQRQVSIEVTIAEVTLTDELQFGVEWLFKGGAPSGRGSGGQFNTSTPFNPAVPIIAGATNPVGLALSTGFNYLINNSNFPGGVQAALHLLDKYGDTKVVSNPHLAALDNQKATIKVGDRIPIPANATVGGATNVITTTTQYIDTGVLLQVTPHINAGGLVTLEVDAEVSTPGTSTDPNVGPPINTRSVQTLLAVPSGQTMIMGGLIRETKQNTSAGLPLISRIPVLGGLFGNQDLKNDRTELVLFITPRVVESEIDTKRFIDDLRRKMERLDDVFPRQKTAPEGGLAP